jgi:serine/threonine protein phosphatase PrpC
MSAAKRLVWTSSSYSHVGMVRKINEDASLELPSLGLAGLWAVADGMGGHEAGDVASRMIVETLRQIPPPISLRAFVNQAEAALHRVNSLIQDKAAREYQHRTIGSTVAILLIYREQAACLWVGDSRIYRLRRNRLQLLTRDHSHVQELLDRGLISAAEADNHPMANVITRAVGSAEDLRIDKVGSSIEPGDVYLLCSDGLNKILSDQEIARLLTNTQSRYAVHTLVNAALRRMADDNVTATVVSISAEEIDVGADTVPIEMLYKGRQL